MTTPDDTRAPLDLHGIYARLEAYHPHRRHTTERGWICCTAHGPADDVQLLIDEIHRLRNDAAAALRDSGWVDPPTYWREREDNSRLTRERDDARRALAETIDELRACADAVNRTVLERKEDEWALAEARSYAAALLPVVEAAKAWRKWMLGQTFTKVLPDKVLALSRAVDALESPAPTGHAYLSTGCLHGEHDYCRCDVGRSGPKTPGQCKFCAAPCRCGCHCTCGKAEDASWTNPNCPEHGTRGQRPQLVARESREESTDGR